jgi:hypothetical protein
MSVVRFARCRSYEAEIFDYEIAAFATGYSFSMSGHPKKPLCRPRFRKIQRARHF